MKYVQHTLLLAVFAALLVGCKKDSMLRNDVGEDMKGYKIAFGDTKKIYTMNPDGSNVNELVDASPISGYVSWSEDAKYVYFASAKGESGDAWEAFRVNVQTKVVTQISNFDLDVRSLGVSPDGNTLAVSVMTGNSNIGNNNNNLTQFSTNLYVVPMSTVEAKIGANEHIVMSDLTPIQTAPNSDQFWFEELNWNHDPSNPILAYTKTWRYDEDDVSYTHVYTIKPDGSENTLIAENQDQPIWNSESDKIMFLGLSYYDFNDKTIKSFAVNSISRETSGGSFSPNGGNYILFEIGDRNRKAGVAKFSTESSHGTKLKTRVDVYEPRWSPIPVP